MKAVTGGGVEVLLKPDGSWQRVDGRAVSETFETQRQRALIGFRGAAWGDSLHDVKESEASEPAFQSDGVCIFDVRLGELRCDAAYIFVGDQLVRGKYILTEDYQNENRYVMAFESLQESLIKKYGRPTNEATYWLGDLYRDEPDKWGMAICTGNMSRYTVWDFPEVVINLGIAGENFKTIVAVEYTSKAHQRIEAEFRDSQMMGDL